jgi:glycosyltransferase involved in cell wall biosynthesis
MGELRINVLPQTWSVRGQRQNPFALGLVPELLAADVIHCHQQHIFASTISALVGRATRKRVFVSDLGGGGWDLSAYVSTDRLYNGHLHISEYSRRMFGQAGKPWAHVIYGGVDGGKFKPASDPASLPPYAKRPVIFVGRLLPHKGVNDLVEAVTSDMSLELLGRPYDARFMADLKRLAEGRNVLFQHESNDVDLVRAYQRGLCVVLPSVYRTIYGGEDKVPELLGQTLLEGMACGIPAICTDVASMPEVVADGVTGFVVPPNDPAALRAKLQWLMEHPIEAAAMGAAARRRVLELFRWDTVVERCLAIYVATSGAGSAAAA